MTSSAKGTAVAARLDRREFIAAAAAGAAAAGLSLPFGAAAVPSPVTVAVRRELLADWHIDDQWGPRYAEAIPYPAPAERPAMAAAVDLVDSGFVCV